MTRNKDTRAGGDAARPTGDVSREFLRAIPKTDLHVHLDGSIRLRTLIELATERNLHLPSYSVSGLKELVFKDRYESLVDYLKCFRYTTAVLQDTEAMERCAYEFALDNFTEGVRYFELRFAPQLHINPGMDMLECLTSVNRGLERARDEWNRKPGVASGDEPPYEYSIIVCAMRAFNEQSSFYYRSLLRVHRYTPLKTVYGLASLELAQASIKIRDEQDLPITGFDLAGPEDGYPASDHEQAYDLAHKHFLKKTVHAGEAYGPESIFQAITDLNADRIGHAYFLLSPEKIQSESVGEPKVYTEELAQFIADRRITLEVCLRSNLQTNADLDRLEDHAFGEMLAHRLSLTICTDNRTVSDTTVADELDLAVRECGLTPGVMKNIVIYGFKRSFYPGSYISKREYVRRIIDYYEEMEKQFGIVKGPGDYI